jgi:dihydrolipoamide dehydrogenase
VLEYLDRILPGMDDEMAAEALKLFKKQGLKFQLGCQGHRRQDTGQEAVHRRGTRAASRSSAIACCSPSAACPTPTTSVSTPSASSSTTAAAFPSTTTSRPAPTASTPSATSSAARCWHTRRSEEGVACVERIVNGYGHVNYDAIPGVCYTEPEIAAVGQTEAQLKEAGTRLPQGRLPVPRVTAGPGRSATSTAA